MALKITIIVMYVALNRLFVVTYNFLALLDYNKAYRYTSRHTIIIQHKLTTETANNKLLN